jgi:hypothetical protein
VLGRPHGCNPWKALWLVGGLRFIKFGSKSNKRIQFWHNAWCVHAEPKNLFPDLFLLAGI